jgi:hypothetical protein
MRRQTLLPSALGHLGAMGSRLRQAGTAVVHPTAPFPAAPASGGCGAGGAVPAAKAERLLSDQSRDLRRDASQWARCADTGRSLSHYRTGGVDPFRTFGLAYKLKYGMIVETWATRTQLSVTA